MTSRYAALSRDELATLVPELLLIGQLIDRSGMAWCITEFGREEMLQIAIEEWTGVQPDLHQADAEGAEVRGRRRHHHLQRPATRHRRTAAVHGLPLHRARPLARRVPPRPLRCAARRRADGRGLRPRACATTSRTRRSTPPPWPPTARRRSGPIHRPPRLPADRHPHCAWTVIIDESYPEVDDHPGDGHRRAEPGPPEPNSTRSTRTTKDRPTIRVSCCPTSTSARSHIRHWSGSPTRSACRCTC